MKPGTRALGVAASASGGNSATVAGAVVRASRVADGFSLSTCTVGGLDSTAAVVDCYERLGREDVRYVLLAGVAPAWFNVVDLRAVHEAVERPVLAVSFEASDGLRDPIEREFSGREREDRLAVYESLPDRHPLAVNGERVFVRSVGCDSPDEVVCAFTPEGGRPEPLRVARLVARAVDDYA
ncbi:endonuclease dU [Halobacterium rubrum]|uniref:endonuclease dU n=1 Tax=Halobacterium TaxID=2239 RepID=UPI001F186E46|nr:DUF99 family protein [Halobacterium rubrum]MDH5019152.1 DUF99 family protein [Halobacterium rubrum]